MLNPLPFEHDSPELLEAVALALAPVVSRMPQPEPARSAERTPVYASWRRESADGAGIISASDVIPETEAGDSWLDLAALHTGFSAEDLSREIERDARRFEAN